MSKWMTWWASVRRRLQTPTLPAAVELTSVGLTCRLGTHEQSVRWDELVRIMIITTDEGPFTDDLFWTFEAKDGVTCVMSGMSVGRQLFERLALFAGVDYGAIIQAQGSTSNASFLVWSRDQAHAQLHADS